MELQKSLGHGGGIRRITRDPQGVDGLNFGHHGDTSGSPTAAQIEQAGEELSKAVKAALLISGADRRRY